MKRVPSFSSRPGFPSGLRVLLVEADKRTRDKVSKQILQLSYVGTCCTSPAEAIDILARRPGHFDVVLAEAKSVAEESPAFVTALHDLPLVLMSEGGSATEVMKSIELGAVEYLEKPLSLLKLRNIWQHVVRKMMQGNGPEDNMLSHQISTNQGVMSENIPALPSSPSTPSGTSCGVDQGFTPVDDSMKGFKLSETLSSSSHSDPSDVFLPDLSACADSDNKQYLQPFPVTTLPADSNPAPPTKRARKGSKDSTSANAAASATHRPPLAIRPAPPSYSMVQSPMMHMGSMGSQWGQLTIPPYVWGTPMSGSPMDSWQSNSVNGFIPAPASDISQCQSVASDFALPSLNSQSSCSTVCMDLDHAMSLSMTSTESSVAELSTIGSLLNLEGIGTDAQTSKAPPIGLQLRKSESFLELINELLQSGK